MNENVLQTIRAGMDTFSKGQKRIAACMLFISRCITLPRMSAPDI